MTKYLGETCQKIYQEQENSFESWNSIDGEYLQQISGRVRLVLAVIKISHKKLDYIVDKGWDSEDHNNIYDCTDKQLLYGDWSPSGRVNSCNVSSKVDCLPWNKHPTL